MTASPNPPRNTYTPEEQERNDALKAQHNRMMAYASRHLPQEPTPSNRHPHPAVCLPTASIVTGWHLSAASPPAAGIAHLPDRDAAGGMR